MDIRFKEVIGFCQRNGYFKTAISRPRSNNTEARLLAKELENIGPPFNDWCLIAKQFETDSTDFIDLSDGGKILNLKNTSENVMLCWLQNYKMIYR